MENLWRLSKVCRRGGDDHTGRERSVSESALLIKYRWGALAVGAGGGCAGAARAGAGREADRLHSAARRAAHSTSVRARGPWSREPMRVCSGAMVTATRTACGAWPTCGAPADVSSAFGRRAHLHPRLRKLGLVLLTSAEAAKSPCSTT